MRSTYIWATTIAVFLTVWLVSGQINSAPVVIDPSIAEQNRIQEEIGSDTIPTRVRAERIRAVEKIRMLIRPSHEVSRVVLLSKFHLRFVRTLHMQHVIIFDGRISV